MEKQQRLAALRNLRERFLDDIDYYNQRETETPNTTKIGKIVNRKNPYFHVHYPERGLKFLPPSSHRVQINDLGFEINTPIS